MNRPVLLGATLALLMTSSALAQDPPAPGTGELLPPPAELAPAAPAPGANPGTAPEAEAESAPTAAEALDQVDRMRERGDRGDRRRGMREDRRDRFGRDGRRPRDRHSGPMGGDEQYEWRDHHRGGMMDGMGMRPRMGSQGAVFRFSRGNGGPSIVIRCADRDTTQECVDAVGPMLQMMLPNAQ